MGEKTITKVYRSQVGGSVVGGDMNITNIIMLQDSEREFVITHNADIRPVSYFTGRETELEELRQRIEEGRKSVLVSGMGGIGKTHICRKLFEEYLNKHADGENIPFRHIGYIEYAGDMSCSLMRCLKYQQQENPAQNQEAAWQELEHLAADGKLLLFVDNVDKPVNTDPGLQRLKGIPGAVILTSRQASFSDEFEPYPIGFLDMEQCKEIYEKIRFKGSKRKVRLEEEQDLKYVMEDLSGRHTITVEFLAHLACMKLWTVKRLREELEQKGFCLTFHKNGELVNIQESYEVLYDLSELTEAEQNILEAFSVFPYIPLEAEICNQWLLADAGASEDDDVLAGLYRKGWLQFDTEEESYSLHLVFARFIYEKCQPKAKRHSGLINGCKKNLIIPESGLVNKCQKFISFAESIIQRLEAINMDKYICLYYSLKFIPFMNTLFEKIYIKKLEEWVDFMLFLVDLLIYTAEYDKAEKWWDISFQIIRKELLFNNHLFFKNCNFFAELLFKKREYWMALEVYSLMIKMLEKKIDMQTDPIYCLTYRKIAEVYLEIGDYEKAEEKLIESIPMHEKVLGETNPNTIKTYIALAKVYCNKDEYGKAEELYKKSIQILERVLVKDHPDIAYAYCSLASLYNSIKDYENAEILYEKSIQILEKVLVKDHPDIVSVYCSLAKIYENKEKYGQAEKLYEKSIKLLSKNFLVYRNDIIKICEALDLLYFEQGKYNKTEKLLEWCLNACKSNLGECHSDTLDKYCSLVGFYIAQENYEKAEKLLTECLDACKSNLGECHSDTLEVFLGIAWLYSIQGKYYEAVKLYNKCLDICQENWWYHEIITAEAYAGIADLYTKFGQYEKAKKSYLECISIYEDNEESGIRDFELVDLVERYYNLAIVLIEQKEYLKSLNYLAKVYKFVLSQFGEEHEDTMAIYEKMRETYFVWFPEGKFERWFEERMQI